MYQHILLQNPPEFTQIGIFGLKIYHLATLDDDVLELGELAFMAVRKNVRRGIL
jgi:hypothetical protein